jgi:hypothetical protein
VSKSCIYSSTARFSKNIGVFLSSWESYVSTYHCRRDPDFGRSDRFRDVLLVLFELFFGKMASYMCGVLRLVSEHLFTVGTFKRLKAIMLEQMLHQVLVGA